MWTDCLIKGFNENFVFGNTKFSFILTLGLYHLFHVPGKMHLGEEEGLEDETEGKSDVSSAPFTGQLQDVLRWMCGIPKTFWV